MSGRNGEGCNEVELIVSDEPMEAKLYRGRRKEVRCFKRVAPALHPIDEASRMTS
jgi:hypothetical protein